MKVKYTMLSPDVNTPGDLHFVNGLHNFDPYAPKCAGVSSGEAKVVQKKITCEINCKVHDILFDHIQCPDTCPRDKQSQVERCLINVPSATRS